MANITTEILRKEIHDILKDADLTDMSSKKVRNQIEQKLDCDLLSRKKEIDDLVMDYVNSKANSDDDESDENDEESVDEAPAKAAKRSAPTKNDSPAKKKKVESDEEESNADDDSDDDYKSSRRSSRGGKKKPSEKTTKKPRAKKDGEKRKGGGYTRPLKLSPALSALLGGTEAAPRHEVVAKVWAIIKERNLYDPKNRQYAICDAELRKVMGIKRFRTFGMLKYLKNHFLE
ncbi:Upstream activation factor subunit spp27 [Pseudolycoriella hygida]|uniref:Upstream activation factor subunit spp27 n=1 Tax=Pseudolycoriella hygida TaxID=35572 RepID=A0A9Q0MWR5_9DIPT|nr:Upstream activation factor subunit spp27 [Pseudolycoriella hygida]